jgi:dolichol-phosphate mannosyltransferase
MEKRASGDICLVVPCYNEEDVLGRLVERLQQFADGAGVPVRMLLIDDGSSDATFPLIEEVCERDRRFACLKLSRNFGHQAAVSAGLRHARGAAVAVLDADLQDPPEVIMQMVAKWREGYDVVYGIRRNRKEGLLLRAAYAGFYRLLKYMANVDIPRDAGDFCLMDRHVVECLNALPERKRFIRGLRGWVGFRQVGLPYDRSARQAGKAKYNLARLWNLAMDGIISFSVVPLRLTMFLGLLAAAGALGLAAWAACSALFLSKTPSGWASLAVMILFFSGVQLIVAGILGEYMGRVFDEVKGRPPYLVSESVGWTGQRDEDVANGL